MSRLEELIKELCPNGVRFEKLGNVVTFLNGRAYKQSELLNCGKYRVLRVGNFFTNDKWYYSDLELEEDKYCNKGDLLYAWAASIGPQIWEGEKVIFHYHIWKLVFDDAIVLKRYLYHFLLNDVKDIYNSLTHSTMPHVSMANMKERRIPVPPLEVQREIVRILDNFTFLSAELSAELSARKKQYEYYRNQLLSIDDESEIKRIHDICDISRGKVISKDYIRDNVGEYPVYSSQTENNGELGRISSFMYDGEYLTWTTDGANAGFIFYRNEQFNITSVCGLLKVKDKDVDIRYLFHALTVEAPKYVSSGMGNPKLMSNVMGSIKISFPSFEKQKRISSILDDFDCICSDVSTGIPAEIQARQKQYEYYRDKLLTFKEKN